MTGGLPRSGVHAFADRAIFPQLRLEASPEEDSTSVWEARYEAVSVVVGRPSDRRSLLLQASDENLEVAAAAQASPQVTANDLQWLLRRRLLVNAGALANPNLGRLPFADQAQILEHAFPEERAVAARNRALHPELRDALAGDECAAVRHAAVCTSREMRQEPAAA